MGRGAGDVDEPSRKGPGRHVAAGGKVLYRQGLVEVGLHPVQHHGEVVAAVVLDHRCLDVLGLAAITVRRHHHASRHRVGDGGAVLLTMCRQRSIPAAVPALVSTEPSSMYSTLGSTLTAG